MAENRDQWGSKIGLILAMAGNAVGLGNFWRFPYIAATNGGGAFMIPYFFALIVIGIPIMLVEWSIGRYGGAHGHGTVGPMIYLQAKKAVKPKTAIILGALAGAIAFGVTLLVNSYYTHIIGWSLGYAVESLLGGYVGVDGTTFFVNYITDPKMLIFWVISLALLGWAVMKGVSEGIEAWAKVMMPTIYVFGIILVIRALTLGAPVNPDWSSMNGLNYVWNPDLSKLNSASIVTATGQIFFTLSLGMGIICNYASYLQSDEDIVAASIATVSLNEFAEVILAGTSVIPISYAFLGPEGIKGSIGLAFMALPNVFTTMAGGRIFGAVWFFLLFFAGFTSAIAMYNYLVALLEEDLNVPRKKGTIIIFIAYLIVLGLIEIIVVAWLVRDPALEEMNKGGLWKVPRWFFKVFHQFLTPVSIIVFLALFTKDYAIAGNFKIIPSYMAGSEEFVVWVNLARAVVVCILILGFIQTYKSIKSKYKTEIENNKVEAE